jgi:hypothetical protein
LQNWALASLSGAVSCLLPSCSSPSVSPHHAAGYELQSQAPRAGEAIAQMQAIIAPDDITGTAATSNIDSVAQPPAIEGLSA